MIQKEELSNGNQGASGVEDVAKEPAVVLVTFEHGAAGRDGAFDLHPAAVPDVIDGGADLVEIDAALAEESVVFLHMELADLVLVTEPADFLVDVVAHGFGVGDVVIDLDGAGPDAIDDVHVFAGTEPAFDPEDDTGLFGSGRDIAKAADDLVGAGLVVFEIAFAEEGEENDPTIHGATGVDAVADPFDCARIALVRDIVEFTDGEGGDGDVMPLGVGLIFFAHGGSPEMHVIGDGAETDLDSVEPDFLGEFHGTGIGEFAD